MLGSPLLLTPAKRPTMSDSDAEETVRAIPDEATLAKEGKEYLTSRGLDGLELAELNKLLEAARVTIKCRQSEKDAKDAEAERGPGAPLLVSPQELLALSRSETNWIPSYAFDPPTAIADCAMRHSQTGCKWEQKILGQVIGNTRMPHLFMYRLKTTQVRVCEECFAFLDGYVEADPVAYALTHGPDRCRLSDDCSNMPLGEYESMLAVLLFEKESPQAVM